ncbi:MAG: polysaccharide deacetylase family protein [Mariprofundaceae bacterium]
MICLTGDIHHSSLGTGNQEHCDISEIQVAQRYVNMLEEADVKATFFVSGKCFAEEWQDMKPICEHELVELGGHTWDCFEPELWHRVCNKLLGSYNGPAWYQRRDMIRTADIIKQKTGVDIRLWRNHMYMHGPNTERLLAEQGFDLCSDGVRRDASGPEWHPDGILDFPINVIPDHEHLYHAERTPEWVETWVKRYNWSDDYGPASYYVEEWTDIVLDCLLKNEERGAVSNMIIHPITLYLCDEFKSFQRILDFLASHETVHMGKVADAAKAGSHASREVH